MIRQGRTISIQDLFSDLDAIKISEPALATDPNWKPVNEQSKEIFHALIAPENREELKAWYALFACQALNPSAQNLRLVLENAIGEKLG